MRPSNISCSKLPKKPNMLLGLAASWALSIELQLLPHTRNVSPPPSTSSKPYTDTGQSAGTCSHYHSYYFTLFQFSQFLIYHTLYITSPFITPLYNFKSFYSLHLLALPPLLFYYFQFSQFPIYHTPLPHFSTQHISIQFQIHI